MNKERIYLFDTTLRDGTHMKDVDFTLHDKVAIARQLNVRGIDCVEKPLAAKGAEGAA